MSSRKSRLPMKILAFAVFVAVAAYGAKFAWEVYNFESTDDAQIAARKETLSARVGGTISEIYVEENQSVERGQVLMKIEDRDFQHRVEEINAQLDQVNARFRNAEKNHLRAQSLLKTRSITEQNADTAHEAYLELVGRRAELNAKLSQARLDLERSQLRAPTDGKVGKRSVEKGVVIAAGQPLIAFVQAKDRWVVANFKETQIRKMTVGQPVKVEIDSIAGHAFAGKVVSFSPASGSTFTVLPPDNATGNYVKIVQRVPVKISLNPESVKGFEERLLPGLSATVTVRVR